MYPDSRDVEIPAEEDQVSVERLLVAPDHETVGWAVEELGGMTYPVATSVVVYRCRKVLQRLGDGLAVYQWAFVENGQKVVISTGIVHGMQGIHLLLYDSQTGKVLKEWNGKENAKLPKWAASLPPRT